ncbi:MAG: hypothetical protein H6684_09200 [Deltaproteobacteria bacterium]|nr:hypothetical protein [bacterium]MCB9476710.1 hypothetical protein [Deltaproteobacteria bacterium]MCB9488893.1 hypothetical protein [Deltaproteobacteria bacterium]
MQDALKKFYDYLDQPIKVPARFLLAVLCIPLGLAFTAPLWTIGMTAPQYPQGLTLDIYPHKVVGGNNGNDVNEINTLNHYIGMAPLNKAQLRDLDWIPFALGLLIILTLRVAVIGNIRMLIDLCVMTLYFSIFAMGRFVYKMWWLGHNLDPTAPVNVDPFTPAIFGTKQIANFVITSLPSMGSVMMGLFAGGVTAVMFWHLISGRLAAGRARKASA